MKVQYLNQVIVFQKKMNLVLILKCYAFVFCLLITFLIPTGMIINVRGKSKINPPLDNSWNRGGSSQ